MKKLFVILFLLFAVRAEAATQLLKTVKPSGGDYTSLEACMNANEQNLVAVDKYFDVEIDGNWSSADTTACTIHLYTTDATRYINIYTTTAARHLGKITGTISEYRLSSSGWNVTLLNILNGFVTVTGLVFDRTGGGGDSYDMFVGDSGSSTATIKIISCIGKGSPANNFRSHDCKTLFINCISYNAAFSGFNLNDNYGVSGCYNCTAIDNDKGFVTNYASSNQFYTNCLSHSNTTADFSQNGGRTLVCNYCSSSDATADDWGGVGNRVSQTFTFIDEVNDNFHLASNDAGARDYGQTNPGSGLFTDDIDGQTRSGTWDIGADEYVAAGGGDVYSGRGLGRGIGRGIMGGVMR